MKLTTIEGPNESFLITDGGSYVYLGQHQNLGVEVHSRFRVYEAIGNGLRDSAILQATEAVEDMIIRTAEHLQKLRAEDPDRYTKLER